MNRVLLIIPEEHSETANTLAEQLTGNPDDRLTFSNRWSATGEAPATHRVACAQMGPIDTAAVEQMAESIPGSIVHVWPDELPSIWGPAIMAVISNLGLRRIWVFLLISLLTGGFFPLSG